MNAVETGLSFLEGLALIASPCILPVLPLVLGASVEGGRKRPFGIILGFVAAFTAFALLSRKLIAWFDIDLDLVKYGSLILLAAFGLVMLSETLSEKFSARTNRFASLGSRLSPGSRDGLFSGLVIGALIGLVWTPCAGPVLAAVLVQVIRQESDLHAIILLTAFAFGAGLPMLVISLTGRKILSKLSFFTKHAEAVRKTFGLLILLAVVLIATPGAMQKLTTSSESAVSTHKAELQDALSNPYTAPEFSGIEAWLNSAPLTMASLKGKVVLVDFWTYSCINCVRTLPYLTGWDRAYRDKGLVIVGIHAPEFEFEKKKENVETALSAHNIEYPVALDNKLDSWTAFKNRYWPAHYLIDQQGRVVYTHFGEGHYQETENNIRYLLGLNEKMEVQAETQATSHDQSPETYLGYARTRNFSSPEGITHNAVQSYTAPALLSSHHWALSGAWKIGSEHITTEEPGAALQYNFTAGKVFLVLGTVDGKPVKASLKLNGMPIGNAAGKDAPDGTLTVDQHALYALVNQSESKSGLLEITANAPGLEAYAFTFGK